MTQQGPSEKLDQTLREFARAELMPWKILARFYAALLVGALLTLTVCPQFGLGPWGGGHGISHWVMRYGQWACGLFCGGVFFTSGALTARLSLSRGEWWWVLRHPLGSTLPLIAICQLLFMGVAQGLRLEGMHESLSFQLAWPVGGASLLLAMIFALAPRRTQA